MSFGTELMKQLDIVAGHPRKAEYRASAGSEQGVKQRVAYILAPKTGASIGRVARLVGVSPATVRAWQGGRVPSARYREKIDEVYLRFLGINNRARVFSKVRKVLDAVKNDRLKLKNDEGDSRFYTPARRWATFVGAWEANNPLSLDVTWDAIVSAWDYPEPWESDRIDNVDIV